MQSKGTFSTIRISRVVTILRRLRAGKSHVKQEMGIPEVPNLWEGG